jgi:hypothetical protein
MFTKAIIIFAIIIAAVSVGKFPKGHFVTNFTFVRFEVFTAVTMKNGESRDIRNVGKRLPLFAASHPRRQYCFHGGDYEEFRFLGYKNPVRTSQETHYISTKHGRLMLCKI